MMRSVPDRRAFTLIELLVVIAVIALLIGILLPALGKARNEGRTMRCAANLRSVGQAVNMYVGDNGYFPPAYVYGSQQEGGSWVIADQQEHNPHPDTGYIHWSWALFDGDEAGGGLPESAFTCPSLPNGGAPRTSPGESTEDWESGQYNDLGNGPGAAIPRDRQAKRMAYTGNAAVFPRNKFNGADQRRNRLVNPSGVDGSARGAAGTILATEFGHFDRWKSLEHDNKIKSHRPITPFVGMSAGADVYNEPDAGNQPRFKYPDENSILRDEQLGVDMIDGTETPLNAVGRHHPGGDTAYGGTANFVFIDGHVVRTTVMDSVRQRLWGDRFFSLTGTNVRVDVK